MAQFKNQQALISNPVFYQLQPFSREGMLGKSVILYANKFSGLDEKEMPEDFKQAFEDNTFNLTSINLRKQIEDILEELDDGPWYADGVNGTLHIHNRKIAPPYFNYRYQDENGEVLKVQVVTNWTTGSSSGTIASNISPNKDYSLIRYEAPRPDGNTPLPLLPPKRFDMAINMDNTQYGPNVPVYRCIWPDGVIDYGSTQRAADCRNAGGTAVLMSNMQENDRGAYVNERVRSFQGQKKAEREKAYNQAMLEGKQAPPADQKTLEDWVVDPSVEAERFDKYTDKVVNETGFKYEVGNETAKLAQDYYNDIVRNGTPLENLSPEIAKYLTQREIALDNPEFYNMYAEVKAAGTSESAGVQVSDKRKVNRSGRHSSTTEYSTPTTSGKIVGISNEDQAIEAIIKAGFTAVTHFGGSQYTSAYGDVLEEYRRAVKEATAKDPNAAVGDATMTWDSEGNVKFSIQVAGVMGRRISLYDLAFAKYRRNNPEEGGQSAKARQKAYINAMRNRAAKAKHKEIEVQMVVVGRPALRAGQYIDIYNIGNKYSGTWYIKTCIHQMDSNGYTCSLTLKKNNPSNGVAAGVNTSKGQSNIQRFIYVRQPSGGVDKLHKVDYDFYNYLRDTGQNEKAQELLEDTRIANELGTYDTPLYQDAASADRTAYASGKGLEKGEATVIQPEMTDYGNQIEAVKQQKIEAAEKQAEMSKKMMQMMQNMKKTKK